MATIEQLDYNGDLVRIDVELEKDEQIWRRLYGTPDFVGWLRDVLPDLETSVIGGEIQPLEQLDAIFHEYVIGESMDTAHQFKRLSWTPDLSVWEFKTADIRVFGWVPQKDVFICAFGDMKDSIETFRKYGRYIVQTQYLRSQMDLDEPKAVVSREYHDVLSDAH